MAIRILVSDFFIKIIYIFVIASSLSHCQSTENHLNSPVHHFEEASIREKWKSEKQPELGVALAGGGTKAGTFSIGVLAGLNDAGLLKNVDIISSVSGGSYAAYFYYSKMMQESQYDTEEERRSWFKSCLTQDIKDKFYGEFQCPGSESSDYISVDYYKNSPLKNNYVFNQPICPPSSVDVSLMCPNMDSFRFQNHTLGYLDFILNDFDYKKRHGWRDPIIDIEIAELTVATGLSIPFHWIANGLFDWRVNLSPSRSRYLSGIQKAYGYTPKEFRESQSDYRGFPITENNKIDGPIYNLKKCKGLGGCKGKRGIDLEKFDAEIASQTFENLKALYERRKDVPLWIINTTSAPRHPFSSSKNSVVKDSFEITPYSYGSTNYGFIENTLENKTVSEIVISSAAFLDFQQDSITPSITNPFLWAANAYWGDDIENPNYTSLERNTHKLLPFPFYWLQPGVFHHSENPLYFHVSDGGQSENLGLISLIRRKVKNIIVSDNGEDKEGKFDDYHKITREGIYGDPALGMSEANHKPTYKWILIVPKLEERNNFDVNGWSSIFLRGTVHIIENINDGRTRDDYAKIYNREECNSNELDSGACLNIFWIKPAWNIKGLDNISTHCSKKPRDECQEFLSGSQNEAIKYPISLVNFYLDNKQGKQDFKYFPQDSTWINSINSSPSIASAYRDLGRYYAYETAIAYEKDRVKYQNQMKTRN